jgi:uncharacterized protein
MNKHLWTISLVFIALTACTTVKKTPIALQNAPIYTNELIKETSPYLRQHAHNPVNWTAWNDKTPVKKVGEVQNLADLKLKLISIGYAACHWCHVMERETFSDTAVANVMNAHFTNIKIDREERPDIDNLYMSACQLTKESGCGWPLNVIALPDGRPVWVGTYTPKKDFLETLNYFIQAQQREPDKLNAYAEQLKRGIQAFGQVKPSGNTVVFDAKDAPFLLENCLKTIDFNNGGQLGTPKFPMPSFFDFLLSTSKTSARFETSPTLNPTLKAVKTTLDKLAKGGIYDQIGGGFARYATDSLWQVPHFEKMLYDNAQLISLYSHWLQLTNHPRPINGKQSLYEKIVRQTLAFVEDKWLSNGTSRDSREEGGFYSSFDADTEGGEGRFYTWTKREIDSILGDKALIFNDFYGITEDGNFESGHNILGVKKAVETISPDGLQTLEMAKNILLRAREKRPQPNLDNKILTAWNALMLTGFVDAYRALGNPKYLDIALKNGQFIIQNRLQANGKLYRLAPISEPKFDLPNPKSISGFLEDYAFTIQAFINLYEVTFDEKWLLKATLLTDYVLNNFKDKTTGFFNFNENSNAPLAARPIILSDDVIPNANATFAVVLNHLGTLLEKEQYTKKAHSMLQKVYETAILSGYSANYYTWCKLFLNVVQPPYEVAIVGDNAGQLRNELIRHYLPNALILGGNTEGGLIPMLEGKLRKGETWIYVCQNKACKQPVKTVAEALKLIQK